MLKEEQLNIELDKLKAAIQRKEWKYYHLQSVDNFIYHLKSFESDGTRDRMAAEIEKYMEVVRGKIRDESTIYNKCKELFPSIWEISDTYKYEIGFIQKPSYLVAGILLVGLFFLQLSISSLIFSLGTCAIVLLIYFGYCYFKMKARKYL